VEAAGLVRGQGQGCWLAEQMGSGSELGRTQREGDVLLTNQVDIARETLELLKTKAW